MIRSRFFLYFPHSVGNKTKHLFLSVISLVRKKQYILRINFQVFFQLSRTYLLREHSCKMFATQNDIRNESAIKMVIGN